jgi:hypothetical protein
MLCLVLPLATACFVGRSQPQPQPLVPITAGLAAAPACQRPFKYSMYILSLVHCHQRGKVGSFFYQSNYLPFHCHYRIMPYTEVRTRHVARNKQKEMGRHAQTYVATSKTYGSVTHKLILFFNFPSVLPGPVFFARWNVLDANGTETSSNDQRRQR